MMGKKTIGVQAGPAVATAPSSHLARLLRMIVGAKPVEKKAKKPLAVAHLYGLPRPGAV